LFKQIDTYWEEIELTQAERAIRRKLRIFRHAEETGAAFYGFTFAANGIEGQTVVFVIPAALAGVVVSGGKRFKLFQDMETNPIRVFFLLAYILSLLLFVYWGIRYSGFPQFSELSWI